jgi:hypothetical protein
VASRQVRVHRSTNWREGTSAYAVAQNTETRATKNRGRDRRCGPFANGLKTVDDPDKPPAPILRVDVEDTSHRAAFDLAKVEAALSRNGARASAKGEYERPRRPFAK